MKSNTETPQQRIDRLEAERIEKSNAKRELDRQRGYVAELDLTLHQTRDRITELRKQVAELEKQLPARERKLTSARVKLIQMECEA
jgi:Tfp pilus assembly protein PilO